MLVTIVVSFSSGFVFLYNLVALNQLTFLIKDFFNETYTRRAGGRPPSKQTVTGLWSLTSTLFVPSGLIGALLSGHLADRIGRIRTVVVSQAFTVVGALLGTFCVVAAAPELLMLSRVVVGIQSGIGVCIVPIAIAELAPAGVRGFLQGVGQAVSALGLLASPILGLPPVLGRDRLWPYVITLQLVSAAVALPLLGVPETPHHLLLNRHAIGSRRVHAAAAVAAAAAEDEDDGLKEVRHSLQYYRQRTDVEAELKEMVEDERNGDGGEDVRQHFTVWRMLTDGTVRVPLIVACVIQVRSRIAFPAIIVTVYDS